MLDPFSIFRMMWLLFGAMAIAFFSMFSRAAHAYVPKARVILEKVGKQHGRGAYIIQQEVTFRDDSGPVTVTEEWLVENGENLSVDVRGEGQRAYIVYKGKQRVAVDESGKEQTSGIPEDFFEPLFYFRSWDRLAEFLNKEKIIPTKNLMRETFNRSTKTYEYVPDPFVRLSRTAGVITFAFGEPSPADSAQVLPGLWVDQDRFLIRRLRLSSQVEVTADDYGEYAHNLWFPRTRVISWGDQTVHIRAIRISSSKSTVDKRKVVGAKASFSSSAIREFYSRFR